MTDVVELNQNKTTGKTLLYPFLAMFLGAIVLVMTAFMPLATASTEFREYLDANPDTIYDKSLNMTNKEVRNISLITFAKIYAKASETKNFKVQGITYLIIIVAFGFFSLLSLLLSWLKKPIGTIIGGLLALATFSLLKAEFTSRGILPNNRYDLGFAPLVIYISIAAMLVGAVTLIILRMKNRTPKNEQ